MPESYNALKIASEATKAEQDLSNILSNSKIFQFCYAMKSRPKTEEGLLEKKERKIDSGKPDYTLFSITDVIGIRFVTLFKLEMPEVFEKIVKIITHEEQLNPNPFLKGKIEEVRMYVTDLSDTIFNDIDSTAKELKIDAVPVLELSAKGYSSIHVIARLTHEVKQFKTDGDGDSSTYNIPVEIQIRTVFEDAWGEIDHKYKYKQEEENENVSAHLKILKKFSDACVDYANQIHKEAIGYSSKPVLSTAVRSVEYNSEILEMFRDEGVDEQFIMECADARQDRLKAEGLFGNAAKNLYLKTADKFESLLSSIDKKCLKEQGSPNHSFYYFISMNMAVCLLSTHDKESITKSLKIYIELETNYPNSPLLKMRHAQANIKLGRFSIAESKLGEAKSLVETHEKEGTPKDGTLTKSDYKHLKSNLPTLLGYTLWQLAKVKTKGKDTVSAVKISEQIDLFHRAYHVTFERAEYIKKEEMYSMHNNLMYYAFEIVKSIEMLDQRTNDIEILHEVMVENLDAHLASILEQIDPKSCLDLELLDTVCKGYHFFDKTTEATELGERIIELCIHPPEDLIIMDELKMEILTETHDMLKEIKKGKKD